MAEPDRVTPAAPAERSGKYSAGGSDFRATVGPMREGKAAVFKALTVSNDQERLFTLCLGLKSESLGSSRNSPRENKSVITAGVFS